MRKIFSSLGVKSGFVLLYLIANVWAAFTVLDRGELIADHAGWPAPQPGQIMQALALIILMYCGVLFAFRDRLNTTNGWLSGVVGGKAMGRAILLIQATYFLFVLVFSAGGAGADAEKGGGALRFIFYVINPDMLFLVYFGVTMYITGKCPHRTQNLLLFLLSNIVRGWLGPLLIIMFIYGILFVERADMNKWTLWRVTKISILSLIGFVAASFLMHIKLALRVGGDAILTVLQNLALDDVILAFFESLFSRLQMLSTVSFQITKQEQLSRFIDEGVLGSFYTDGLPQQVLYKVLGVEPGENLNLFLWKYYIPGDFFEAQTTVQPGLVGWLYILPFYSLVFFFLYIVMLLFINKKLIEQFGGRGLRHLSWFCVFLFLLPGWLGAYISFLWALVIFIGLAFIIRDQVGPKAPGLLET